MELIGYSHPLGLNGELTEWSEDEAAKFDSALEMVENITVNIISQ